MKNITKEQENFLNEYTNDTWKLNTESGLVDIDGDFNCSNKGLSDFLGIEFGNISGSFNCSYNKLVSLEGGPKEIGGSFDCYNNKLVSLEGGPQEVGGAFDCSYNELISLKGSPQKVGGYFDCSNNQLVSLEGGPKEIGGSFDCSNNQLVSLKGSPKKVGESFYCHYNQLISLNKAPNVLLFFYCDPISLRSIPISLLGKINFYRRDNQKTIRLEDLAKGITDGLVPDIYFKKMI